MISRKNRFHGHASVRNAYRRGKSVRSSFGSLHYEVNPKRRDYRLAVVVSKKVNKSAVERNRIRRRVFEIMRLEPAVSARPYDLVVTIQDGSVAETPSAELESQLHRLLKQAGIVR